MASAATIANSSTAKTHMAEAPMTEEDVCAHVRDSVLERRLAPGTKLTEESLCSIFGVGRTTVRRAFLLLKRDNIVDLHRNRGAVVASPTPAEARDVFESRRMIEHALLQQAASTIAPASITALEDHLEQERTALTAGDVGRWIRLTGDFHLHLARLAGNRVMLEFLKQLVFQTSLIVALYGPSNNGSNCSGGDHAKIVAAMRDGDLSSAQDILDSHLREIEAQLEFNKPEKQNDLVSAFAPMRSA